MARMGDVRGFMVTGSTKTCSVAQSVVSGIDNESEM